MESFQFFKPADLKRYLSPRKGEKRMGQSALLLYKGFGELGQLKEKGVKYCLLGVPECIGPLGNRGKAGAQGAWEAFLHAFLNIQTNRFFAGKELVIAGQVKVDDLMKEAMSLNQEATYYLQQLHILCERLDERVEEAIRQVVSAGIVPIVIGGGHNNSYPIISGLHKCLGPVHVLNIDAHADFRDLEGRHSGNGFSYAFQKGFLRKYAVYGLHQNYNSENMLKSMDTHQNVSYTFFEEIQYTDKLFHEQVTFLSGEEAKGLEIDMDAIRNMPSSAMSPSGFSLDQMRYYLRKASQALHPAYLHLAEAAPKSETDQVVVGKALTYLVTDFIKNCP
jgi:formiminoglutamase